MNDTTSETIAVAVAPRADGRYVCEVASALAGGVGATTRFWGQTANHAIANALEGLARSLRMEVEASQNVPWDAGDEPSSEAAASDKRFHVIVHYERLVDEKSKFEAMHETILGNTVIENAELTLIQVAPDCPELAWTSRSETQDEAPGLDHSA